MRAGVPAVDVVALRRRRPAVEVADDARRLAVDVLHEEHQPRVLLDDRRPALRGDVAFDGGALRRGIRDSVDLFEQRLQALRLAGTAADGEAREQDRDAARQIDVTRAPPRAPARRWPSARPRRSAVRTPPGCRARGSCAPRRSRPSRPGFARTHPRARSDGRSNGMPAAAFSGIRLTLAFTPASRRASRRASAGVSFTPLSMTYSKVIRLRLASGKRRQASMMACRPYFRLGGTIAARCSSVVAWSEMARFGISGSSARRSIIGTRPTVDKVTRLGGNARPSGSFKQPQRLHRRVVVVQRLAHAHQHDVERRRRGARWRRPAPAPVRRSRRRSGCAPAPSCR